MVVIVVGAGSQIQSQPSQPELSRKRLGPSRGQKTKRLHAEIIFSAVRSR
jgi:hypothetical protein